MPVTRTNVDWWKNEFRKRVGNEYVYGGVYSKTNVRQGCDCSALTAHLLNGVIFGPNMVWSRTDPTRGNAWITTESWRPIEVGQKGPFGTITVARPQDIPADAAVKIALHHGPGGGANSHVWMECDGVRMESNGDGGTVTGGNAMAITNNYGNDWAYLPGPIGPAGPVDPDAFPLPDGYYYGPLDGPEESIAGLDPGDAQAWRDGLGRWQLTLGLPVTRIWDPATKAAATVLQKQKGWPANPLFGYGGVYLGEWTVVIKDGWRLPNQPPPASPALTDSQRISEIWDQLRGPGGLGWAQLGGKTIVDSLADAHRKLDALLSPDAD
jgi:hypothetical protein